MSHDDNQPHDPLHVAIIMDGNGRWATRRGLPRTAGHRAGVDAVRRVVEAAPALGITTLTLFAFSSDNWRRPRDEVGALMALLRRYLQAELARLVDNGVRLTVIGRRDRLPDGLGNAIADAERRSAAGTRLHLRIAIDYSSRDAIAQAAARWRARAAAVARGVRPAAGGPQRQRSARRRSPHSHRRREAAVGFPALGNGLRRALLRRHAVARLRRRRPARRTRRFPSPRAPLRRHWQHPAAYCRRITLSS